MLAQILDKAKQQLEVNLPFVLYRKPNSTMVHAGYQSTSTVFNVNSFDEKGFVFAPFNSDSPIVLLKFDEFLEETYESVAVDSELEIDYPSSTEGKEMHIELVKKAISKIENTNFKKVVVSRKIELNCTKNPFLLFSSLLQKYASAFCYLWYHPKVGMWLGATPEILLKLENKRLTTMSLAGTKSYEKDKEVIWGTKELVEQNLVTEYITNALENKVDKLLYSKVESIRAGNLWHLRTKLTADIKDESLKSILQVLHPTPAVCGMPKEETKSFILEEENYKRAYYTGYLGELNFKQENLRTTRRKNTENNAYKSLKTVSELYVNLRCMQLKDAKAIIYVGGGITKDSDPEKEWKETVNKSKTMLFILNTV
ncbi:chorismate-binding protein [Maribacter vaceletii]|nr:chorismate-binding protein [Maribacter vaceletii]